jgi:uncharacterized protein YbcV (DUF1398 family)
LKGKTMTEPFQDVAVECTEASDSGRVTFPQVIGKLMAAGVERYHADLVRAERTYFLPSGASVVTAGHKLAQPPAQNFSAAGVETALRAIQRDEIPYREFCARIAAAGCVGYIVSLAGRRVTYYGRTNEAFVESFPQKA